MRHSGHGGKIRDNNADELDRYDETLIPVDHYTAGQIRDDDVYDGQDDDDSQVHWFPMARPELLLSFT